MRYYIKRDLAEKLKLGNIVLFGTATSEQRKCRVVGLIRRKEKLDKVVVQRSWRVVAFRVTDQEIPDDAVRITGFVNLSGLF